MDNRKRTLAPESARVMHTRIGRRGVLKGAAGFGAAVPLLGTLGAMPTRAARAQEGGSGGIVVFDLGSEPENLDPHQALAYTTARLDEQICEPLVRFVPGTLDIQPWLAASWETSPDGLEWAFTLQPDVTFHDGSPLDAETVKFSFDRQLDEASPYFAMGQWASAVELNIIDAIRVDAPDVVTFTLTGPYSKFLSRMAVSAGAWIVSKAAVEQFGEAFLENPVGTGPYVFDRWEKGQQVVLRRNDAYWAGTPGLDEIYFRAIPEEGARLAALLSDQVNMSLDIGPETVELLSASDAHQVVSGPTGAVWFLAMNVESEPFQDLKVRQAVNYAVDKRAIVEDVLRGTVEIAHGPLAPAYPDYNPAVAEFYPYDPEMARQLLTEAGWPADREVVFRCSIGGSGMLLPEEMATVIQDNLRAVGMQTRLEVTEFVSWMDSIRNPQNELTVMSWNLPPIEPDIVFNGVLTEAAFPPGFNTSYWTDPEVEELVAGALTTPDPEEAKANYMRAQEIVMEQAPIVPVCHKQQIYGVSNRVHGFAALPSMELDLRNAWVEG